MRLVACSTCHAQYDVTHVRLPSFPCRCGARVETTAQSAVEAEIKRCASCAGAVAPGSAQCGYCGSTIERDARRRSMVCPECRARNVGSARFCAACGVPFRPITVDPERPALPCPECEGMTMLATEIGGVPVDECGHCNGLWVEGSRFDELVEKTLESTRHRYSSGVDGGLERAPVGITELRSKIRYRRCPTCGEFMQRKNFANRSGVIIDWCGDHGTWLDADELEMVSGFILSGGMDEEPTGPRAEDAAARFMISHESLARDLEPRPAGFLSRLEKLGQRRDGRFALFSDFFRHILDW